MGRDVKISRKLKLERVTGAKHGVLQEICICIFQTVACTDRVAHRFLEDEYRSQPSRYSKVRALTCMNDILHIRNNYTKVTIP